MKECLLCHSCFGDHMMNCDRDGAKLVDTLPGTPLLDSRYRLDRQLGAGSMYIIFEGTIIKSSQSVMVKILLPELLKADPTLQERFMQQMSIAASLEHANIARVLDYGQADGLVYLVNEYFDSFSLTEMLSMQGTLSSEQALSIVMQICEGVSIAHRRNLQHRDLKLSNILVANNEDQTEIVKIYDFGFARLKTEDLLGVVTKSRRDQLLGLPLYTAPEQFDSIAIDGRADVYSIGAILYHLLSGQAPFKGKNYAALKEQHLSGNVTPLRELCPDIPSALEELVMKSLSKKMAQRPISVMTMAVQLAALLAEEKESLLEMMAVPAPNQYEPSAYQADEVVSAPELPQYEPPQRPVRSSSPQLLNLSAEAEALQEYLQDADLEQTAERSPIYEEPGPIDPEPEPVEEPGPIEAPAQDFDDPRAIYEDRGMMPSGRGVLYEDRGEDRGGGSLTDPNLSELKMLAQSLFNEEDFLTSPTEKHERIKRSPTSPLPAEATKPPRRRTRRHASMSLEGLLPEALSQIEAFNQSLNQSDNLPSGDLPGSNLSGDNLPSEALPSNVLPNENFIEIQDLSTRPERPLSIEMLEQELLEEELMEQRRAKRSAEPRADSRIESRVESRSVLPATPILPSNLPVPPSPPVQPTRAVPPSPPISPAVPKPPIAPIAPITPGRPAASAESNVSKPQEADRAAVEPIPDTRPIDKVKLPENLQAIAESAVINLSPSSVIYLFANQFVPVIQPGQRRRRLHIGFVTERERLSALLLTAALFSLRGRGAISLVTGATESRKWQRNMRPQRNEGFVVEGVNLEIEPLDMLESKILGALKQDSPTRFYNIFLFIAQTSVATVDGEAICEIVADAIADELAVRKLLRSNRRTDQLVAGESGIQYEINANLQPYHPQVRYVNSWLLSLQQEPTTMIAGRPIQPLTHILKYYTDLFRHNSRELENEE